MVVTSLLRFQSIMRIDRPGSITNKQLDHGHHLQRTTKLHNGPPTIPNGHYYLFYAIRGRCTISLHSISRVNDYLFADYVSRRDLLSGINECEFSRKLAQLRDRINHHLCVSRTTKTYLLATTRPPRLTYEWTTVETLVSAVCPLRGRGGLDSPVEIFVKYIYPSWVNGRRPFITFPRGDLIRG